MLQTGQTAYTWQHTAYTVPQTDDLVVYELLIRDFTEEGTYQAVTAKLDYLEQLGINAIELMPFNEHFADVSEEKILTAYKNGMLVWGNANYNFNEATMGYYENGKSDFSWASWQKKRGFSKPGLLAYMESHDEERLMYKNLTYGASSGSYSVKNLSTALDRNALAAAFFFCLTGPKMIWQFGELGYDVSIDQNGRTGDNRVAQSGGIPPLLRCRSAGISMK